MQKCLFNRLMRTEPGSSGSLLSEVKIGCEESEGKSPDTEGHVETSSGLSASKPEAWEGIASGGFWSLTLGSGRNLLSGNINKSVSYSALIWSALVSPWVRALRAAPPVQRNDFFFADPRFTDWTDLSGGPGLQPLKLQHHISPSTPSPIPSLTGSWPDVNTASRRDVHTWRPRHPGQCPGICCTEGRQIIRNNCSEKRSKINVVTWLE